MPNLYLCRQNKPYLLWLSKAIHCKLYIPWCLKETITRKRTFLWIYTTARIDHFLQFLPVSTFSKCRKIGHKTNMVQRLNSLNTPYHTVLERGFWIIATNVKYDTNRLKMKVYVVFNKDGVPYVIHTSEAQFNFHLMKMFFSFQLIMLKNHNCKLLQIYLQW